MRVVGAFSLSHICIIYVGNYLPWGPCIYGPVKLADVSVQNCKGIISLSDFQLWLAYLWSGADCLLHGVGAAIICDTQEFLTTCAGYLLYKILFLPVSDMKAKNCHLHRLWNDSSTKIKSLDVVDAMYIASNKLPQWGSLCSSQ